MHIYAGYKKKKKKKFTKSFLIWVCCQYMEKVASHMPRPKPPILLN